MTITVRQIRRGGVAVRLTGAHARVFTGLLVDLLQADPANAASVPVLASATAPASSETPALGASSAPEGSQSL